MVNEKIYDIDHQKLGTWLTPPPMRRSVFLTWMTRMIGPFVVIYQALLLYRSAKIYQLLITPQVCYLERLLNDRYDHTQRRIYITDGEDKPPTYIYQNAELKPLYVYNNSEGQPARYIYTSGESGDHKDDFIIWVPVAISFENAEMVSLVKGFKLAGTKFKIQRF